MLFSVVEYIHEHTHSRKNRHTHTKDYAHIHVDTHTRKSLTLNRDTRSRAWMYIPSSFSKKSSYTKAATTAAVRFRKWNMKKSVIRRSPNNSCRFRLDGCAFGAVLIRFSVWCADLLWWSFDFFDGMDFWICRFWMWVWLNVEDVLIWSYWIGVWLCVWCEIVGKCLKCLKWRMVCLYVCGIWFVYVLFDSNYIQIINKNIIFLKWFTIHIERLKFNL